MKSTVEPLTIRNLSFAYSGLRIMHNPEFLTARTAYHDFHNQSRIILGTGPTILPEDVKQVTKFYKDYYPNGEISICTSDESETMKMFVNCFYASKIQLFNEFYMMCKSTDIDFNNVK